MSHGLTAGQVLGGRFELREPFAEDPLLEVWLAEDRELRRAVVVKVLLRRWMDEPEMVERFRFEALAAARLVHENVARTYDVEHADGRLFAVSEYVAGPTVAELVADGPLPPRAVAAIGQQAATGLAAVHADGLVHGSVAPQNLVVAPHGRLCLIDFGSVRPTGDAGRLPGPVFPEPGVADYWPPERRAGAAPDERSDVHSLGLVLWEALTGRPEVASGSPPGRRLLASLPGGDEGDPRLRELLTEATASRPEDRPAAVALADRLTAICGERPRTELLPFVDGDEPD